MKKKNRPSPKNLLEMHLLCKQLFPIFTFSKMLKSEA